MLCALPLSGRQYKCQEDDAFKTSSPVAKSLAKAELSLFFILLTVSREDGAFSGHLVTGQIFVIGGDLVDQLSAGQNLHDPVGGGLYELMVVAGEQHHARELDHTVVQGSDGFHVQVVGGFIKD